MRAILLVFGVSHESFINNAINFSMKVSLLLDLYIKLLLKEITCFVIITIPILACIVKGSVYCVLNTPKILKWEIMRYVIYFSKSKLECTKLSDVLIITLYQVCGCPLVTNVFDLTGEFCRAPKKHCVKHYCWEKLRRAEIDMERVRQVSYKPLTLQRMLVVWGSKFFNIISLQYMRADELMEQERQLRHKLANRSGVLALMLHSTYNHEVMEQMTAQQAQQQQNMENGLFKNEHHPSETKTENEEEDDRMSE